MHIYVKWSDLNITTVKCKSFHRRALPFLPIVYDMWRWWWVIVHTHTHAYTDGQNDQSLNFLQCSLCSPWRSSGKLPDTLQHTFPWTLPLATPCTLTNLTGLTTLPYLNTFMIAFKWEILLLNATVPKTKLNRTSCSMKNTMLSLILCH